MWIESVTAHAFGPLTGDRLELAPGLTVVIGPNESAKSTWHAAITAALCGLARRRGRVPRTEQVFADLHQPWDTGGWAVSAVLRLDDGRRVEIRQDLAARTATVVDVTRGRPVPTGEIVRDGCPDATAWVGLDRRSFAATASVSQADVLAVRDDPEHLRTLVQRVAATGGADATAAEAIELVDAFRREHVGVDDARSTRPLRRATVAEARARHHLAEARAAHERLTEEMARVDRLRRGSDAAQLDVRRHLAAAARARATALAVRAERVRGLAAQLGDQRPSVSDDGELAEQVAVALQAWQHRPAVVPPDGPSVADLDAQLAQLPQVPDGDLAVAPALADAWDRADDVRRRIEAHRRTEPPPASAGLPEVTADVLVETARQLEQALPTTAAAERRLAELGESLAQARRRQRRALTVAGTGAVAVVLGATLAVVGARPPLALVVALAIGGLGLLGWGFARVRTAAVRSARAASDHAAAELGALGRTAAAVTEDRRSATDRCAVWGVSADPSVLRALAAQVAGRSGDAERRRRWQQRAAELDDALAIAIRRLGDTLVAHGVDPAGDPVQAYLDHRQRCADRARTAATASSRQVLLERRARRLAAEERAAAQLDEARRCEDGLRAAAARALPSVPAAADQVAEQLRAWQQRRLERIRTTEARLELWSELDRLCGGETVEAVLAAAAHAAAEADTLAVGLDPTAVAELAAQDPAAALPRLRRAANDAAEAAARAEGELAATLATLPDVAAAEEALTDAVDELASVRLLERTLAETSRLLADAQDKVQRDLAPILTATLVRWLPEVTSGRYVDAMVDLDTLDVSVCGPNRRWRRAAALSHGTAEQVHLVLRAALVEHLTAGYDRCPLLLDDVTVHADDERTLAILQLVHRLSEDRQVVLFAQERLVGEWAATAVRPDRDRLVRLAVVAES